MRSARRPHHVLHTIHSATRQTCPASCSCCLSPVRLPRTVDTAVPWPRPGPGRLRAARCRHSLAAGTPTVTGLRHRGELNGAHRQIWRRRRPPDGLPDGQAACVGALRVLSLGSGLFRSHCPAQTGGPYHVHRTADATSGSVGGARSRTAGRAGPECRAWGWGRRAFCGSGDSAVRFCGGQRAGKLNTATSHHTVGATSMSFQRFKDKVRNSVRTIRYARLLALRQMHAVRLRFTKTLRDNLHTGPCPGPTKGP